jgi:hypothetical protein
MKRKRRHEPIWLHEPFSRTRDGYLTVQIDSSTALTLSQWADLHALPVDSVVRYGIDLAIERLVSAPSDEIIQVIKRSSRHHVPEPGLAWGWGYREHEIKATLPNAMLPQFRECSESESWNERERKLSKYLNTIAEVKGSDPE